MRDIGFNLYVAPFPNIYVPNFKLEGSCQRFSVFGGPRVGESEVWRFGGSEAVDDSIFKLANVTESLSDLTES